MNDTVIINLDRPRRLWCGHRALKTISALTGKSITEINPESFSGEDVEIFMYAMLLTDAKEKRRSAKAGGHGRFA